MCFRCSFGRQQINNGRVLVASTRSIFEGLTKHEGREQRRGE